MYIFADIVVCMNFAYICVDVAVWMCVSADIAVCVHMFVYIFFSVNMCAYRYTHMYVPIDMYGYDCVCMCIMCTVFNLVIEYGHMLINVQF